MAANVDAHLGRFANATVYHSSASSYLRSLRRQCARLLMVGSHAAPMFKRPGALSHPPAPSGVAAGV
eukprot:CAMPEP_0206132886 /NCGR_PEP_ID=MMETSP1472-20131121/51186_1 /ASSEMBLY_ACC=CAM_ASM_001108 /TAXON_ID=41880 /ORGANISM="Pycnococcus provasolii, Strain RCC251" /LENGTH=66 /DNA_ID=CAMNT_0053524415 /DNA_START=113 /DNA_END=310 /DNA_ORIENTATION=-